MPYKGKTSFYQLPYMKKNDYLTASEEERRATIIDNLLYVATYGASNAIVEDASYKITQSKTNPDSFVLTIDTLGSGYVFLGIVNYRLAYRRSPVVISLDNVTDTKYYIYALFQEGMEIAPEKCSISRLTEPRNDIGSLLLCTVEMTEEGPVLDTDSDKRYLSNLASHTMDNNNPHGTTLVQNELFVKEQLYVGKDDIPVLPVIYRDVELKNGEETIIDELPITPVFVSVMSSNSSIGNVFVTIDGTAIKITCDGTGGSCKARIEGNMI